MASPPPPKSSKRQKAGQGIRRGYDRLKQAIRPSSHLSPQNSGSGTPISTGARTPSPAPSANPSEPTAPEPVLPQALALAGLSTLGTSTAPTTRPIPNTTARLEEFKDAAWSGLEAAFRVLESSAEVFPPLKLAVGGFVDCLDIVQAAATNVESYEELTLELTTMAGTLNQYLSELGSVDPSGSATLITLSINTEVAHIEKQQGRGKGRRLVESAQDKEDVIRRYRRIEGMFRQLQSDIGLRTWRNTNAQYMTTLLRGMSPVDDARYNSSYSTTIKRRGCTAETREKVQADLHDWVRDLNAAKVYWMNGMAGTGKTTIAYSLCEWLEANQQLGASFFCSRASSSCRNINLIVPTIAYQLARYSPVFQAALCKVLKEDPDASKLNVVRQFEKLIREPMLAGKDGMPEGVVIVIDALDECEDDYGVQLVLGTVLRLGVDLPVKLFVTSRPEPAIRDNMLSPSKYPPMVLHLHDIEQWIVEGDIKKYLIEALSSMSPPPSNEQIGQLANRAGKLFIYAATAVRYILPGRGPTNSSVRLNAVLLKDSRSTNNAPSRMRYQELDELYSTILTEAFNDKVVEEEEMETMRLVLWTAVCAKEPATAPTIASLLDLHEEHVLSALQPLRSVLHVSEADGLVSTLHASFPDYMLDKRRSGIFFCDQPKHSELLAHRCFEVMRKQLRFNICGLESSFIFDRDVPDLVQRIKTRISSTLFYTCQHWGGHLFLAGDSDALRERFADFIAHKLLFWMEVLNLKQCIMKGISTLILGEKWLSAVKASHDAQKQASDAREFVTRFAAGACSRSTPHIYVSALPFCARSSTVYAHYWGCTHGLMDVRGTALNQRDKAAQATWVTDAPVFSAVFSPDGARVVYSAGRTVRVCDAYTGDTTTGPLIGHTGEVNAVAFSPKDPFIVSGSADRTIRVWDAQTGDTVGGPFKGHTGSVESVAFSPNGTRIVSGSGDCTIRVWDTCTGNNITGPLKGHTSLVKSVGLSSDGTLIVSGSFDRTIRVWNACTGDTIGGPLEGHLGSVYSVAFSPDNTCIVSGSSDTSIRVWNTLTGELVAGPFTGHIRTVFSVVFSPDGTQVVSGSGDHTIRFWDAQTGKSVAGPFQGHTNWVCSVAFSLDGTRIVSGSDDQTIQVCDARIGDGSVALFKGHTQWIKSVIFSPDGTCVASGSSDCTIRVWDACTGDTIAGPFEGHTGSVYSIAFSPDGNLVVSGSADTTIRLWDARTGDAVGDPLVGHTTSVNSLAFAPDGTSIVSGSSDRTIRLWDVRTGYSIAWPFYAHAEVNSVAFSPNGTHILAGLSDPTIRAQGIRTSDRVMGPFIGHRSPVNSVTFSPSGTLIASGSDDQTIRVWDAHTGNTIAKPFEGHTASVESVAFSPDGTLIVSGSSDHTIRVWDVHTGHTIAGPFTGHTNWVKSVAFSPDGTRIVSGSSDQTIRVWDIGIRGVATEPLRGHTSSVYSFSRSPEVTQVAASGFSNGQDVPLPNIPTILTSNSTQQRIHDPLTAIEGFKPNDDGWITTNDIPLFWVSPDFCAHVPHPQNTLVIGPDGTVFIDYRHLLLGERWSECYIHQ